jgi:hypothetical protein
MIAVKHQTVTGGIALESPDGKSGVCRTGDGRTYSWGDPGVTAVLLSELADEPEDAVHLSDAGTPPSAPNVAAEVAEVREKLYGDGLTVSERADAADVRRTLSARTGHTDEDARQAAEVRAFIEPRAGRRTPSTTPWESEGAEGSGGGTDDVADLLRNDAELARVHSRLSEGQAPLSRPKPAQRDESRPRDAADPMVLTGTGRRTPLPQDRGVPMLTPQSIAQLRGFARSDDPADRAKVRHAVTALPSLAVALGQDLMRRLKEDTP